MPRSSRCSSMTAASMSYALVVVVSTLLRSDLTPRLLPRLLPRLPPRLLPRGSPWPGSALAPDDPAGALVGGDDPPARRGVRPARLSRLPGRPPRLDHGRPGRQRLPARREELELGPGDAEHLRHPLRPGQRGRDG